MKIIKSFIINFVTTIYPQKCICCGDIIDENVFLCECCDLKIERTNLDNICLECGLEKNNCCCKYNVFRFNKTLSPLKNTGISRKAYYSYKFGKKQHLADFFAEEISMAINNCYKNVNFDLICYVPSYKKRYYNHSGYIAKSISQKLNLPFHDDLLLCVKNCKKQHKSTIKERINNVYGKYASNYRIDGKTVLLIDDIKTTGATLDECTRVLLFAGAESVYCATALSGSD